MIRQHDRRDCENRLAKSARCRSVGFRCQCVEKSDDHTPAPDASPFQVHESHPAACPGCSATSLLCTEIVFRAPRAKAARRISDYQSQITNKKSANIDCWRFEK